MIDVCLYGLVVMAVLEFVFIISVKVCFLFWFSCFRDLVCFLVIIGIFCFLVFSFDVSLDIDVKCFELDWEESEVIWMELFRGWLVIDGIEVLRMVSFILWFFICCRFLFVVFFYFGINSFGNFIFVILEEE